MEKVCHGPKSKSMEAWRARDRIKMCARRATVILTLTILARDDDATIQSRSCKYEATRTLEKHEKPPQTEPRLRGTSLKSSHGHYSLNNIIATTRTRKII